MIRTREFDDLADILHASFQKAVDSDPLIIENGKDQWTVTGSQGDVYTVRFGYNSAGEAFIDCTCEASKYANNCYHAAAVFFTYIQLPDFGKGTFDLSFVRNMRVPESARPYLKNTEQKSESIGKVRI